MVSLTQLLTGAARSNPGGVGTSCAGRHRTWSELQSRVRRAAALYLGLGLAPGDRVAILAPNSDNYFEHLFAVNWAGGVLVPINTRLAAPEIVDWLQDSGARFLALDDPFTGPVSAIMDRLPGIEERIYIGHGDTPAGHRAYESALASLEEIADAGRGGEDLAAIFYTGGTTGRSKGVMISHEGMFTNILQWAQGVGVSSDDRFLIVPPMFHAAGGENSLAVAALGAHACIPGPFDPETTLQTIEREQITKLPLVATMVDMLVRHPRVDEFDLSSVTRITYGASPIGQQTLTRALEVFPNARFYQVYGQTEGGPTISVLPPRYHVLDGPFSGKLRSTGKALIGVELSIRDAGDAELPPGEVGEICVRGPGVSPGYWNLPEETAKALRDGWLHTGDAGYLDEDGFLFIVDRVKDMIISGGENVYPAEVEAALGQHPEVEQCAVIGIPSERWGEQVHAIVRRVAGSSLGEDELIEFCRARVAGYKCIKSVTFREEPFPVSAAAKVLKRELRRPYWEHLDRRI